MADVVTRSGRSRSIVSALLVVVAAVLVGCTEDPEPEDATENPITETAFGTKPDLASLLDPDRGQPPSSLQVQDLVEGDGDEVTSGSTVVVHYAGALWRSGVEFDATWDVDQPFEFEVGADRVIEGWERGLVGGDGIAPMRVGGRRMLIIPPELAYGDQGAGEEIGPGDTVVYVVDLLDVGSVTTATS